MWRQKIWKLLQFSDLGQNNQFRRRLQLSHPEHELCPVVRHSLCSPLRSTTEHLHCFLCYYGQDINMADSLMEGWMLTSRLRHQCNCFHALQTHIYVLIWPLNKTYYSFLIQRRPTCWVKWQLVVCTLNVDTISIDYLHFLFLTYILKNVVF